MSHPASHVIHEQAMTSATIVPPNTVPRSLTMYELSLKLKHAPKGARIVYHTGSLWVDRYWNREGREMAKVAWNAYMDDKVALFQKRLGVVGENCFQYIAVKR